jgi:hypothetical protein
MRYVYLGQQEKSALAEHRFETWHHIDFSRTIILVKATGYTDHMIKEEAVEVRLHPRNCNRDSGFTVIQSWYPVRSVQIH